MADSRYCGNCETDGALRDVDDRLRECALCGHQDVTEQDDDATPPNEDGSMSDATCTITLTESQSVTLRNALARAEMSAFESAKTAKGDLRAELLREWRDYGDLATQIAANREWKINSSPTTEPS